MKTFFVELEVLEYNTYSVSVEASSVEEAKKKALETDYTSGEFLQYGSNSVGHPDIDVCVVGISQ